MDPKTDQEIIKDFETEFMKDCSKPSAIECDNVHLCKKHNVDSIQSFLKTVLKYRAYYCSHDHQKVN